MEEQIKIPHSIVQLTKDTIAVFDFSRGGKLYYTIDVEDLKYTFPIDVTNSGEVGEAIFGKTEKASLFRRYINVAIKNSKLSWIKI